MFIRIKSNPELERVLACAACDLMEVNSYWISLRGDRQELHRSGIIRQVVKALLTTYVYGAQETEVVSDRLTLTQRAVLNAHPVEEVEGDVYSKWTQWYMEPNLFAIAAQAPKPASDQTTASRGSIDLARDPPKCYRSPRSSWAERRVA
jgi:hypothetical protein